MKLLDYIRGLRKGKEAHRLEKESMKDSFLADAMDGYSQVEGNHEERIRKLRMQVSAHSSKRKNSYAVTWSIAACLVIGIGISSYFLFLKKSMTEDMLFIAKEDTPSAVFEPASPPAPAPVSAPTPAVKENTALSAERTDWDSAHEVTVKQTGRKDIIAKSKSAAKTQDVFVEPVSALEESAESMMMQEAKAVVATDTFHSESDNKMRIAKVVANPTQNMIKGKVTNEKGEPIIGASVLYKGTNFGTITDLNGEFSLLKQEGQKKLTAQYIGYESVEIPVDSSRTMLIAMNEDNQTLSEVVVVGYGAQKKKKSITAGNVAAPKGKIDEKSDKKIDEKNGEKIDEQTPEPIIGKRKYQKYLKDSLIRPTDESCKDVKGEVILSFLIDKEGKPQNITVTKGLCESADKEAIRLIKEGPKWTAGKLPVEVKVKF